MNDMDAAEFEFVEPRFVSIRLVGKLDGIQMGAIMDALEDAVTEEPFFALELFMGNLESLTPESRRIAAERLQTLPDRAIAVIGGSYQQNILAKLVLTAVAVLTKNEANLAKFFSEPAEARQWLKDYASNRSAG